VLLSQKEAPHLSPLIPHAGPGQFRRADNKGGQASPLVPDVQESPSVV